MSNVQRLPQYVAGIASAYSARSETESDALKSLASVIEFGLPHLLKLERHDIYKMQRGELPSEEFRHKYGFYAEKRHD